MNDDYQKGYTTPVHWTKDGPVHCGTRPMTKHPADIDYYCHGCAQHFDPRTFSAIQTTPIKENTKMVEELYYILSPYAPVGNSALWWADEAHGYTSDLKRAWKVGKEKAQSIIRMGRGDRAFKTHQVDAHAISTFDTQNIKDIEELKCQYGPI